MSASAVSSTMRNLSAENVSSHELTSEEVLLLQANRAKVQEKRELDFIKSFKVFEKRKLKLLMKWKASKREAGRYPDDPKKAKNASNWKAKVTEHVNTWGIDDREDAAGLVLKHVAIKKAAVLKEERESVQAVAKLKQVRAKRKALAEAEAAREHKKWKPAYSPSSPPYVPSSPAYSPAYSPPVETPLVPVETPLAPVETPLAPVETPLAPVETPLAPVETPLAPVETPLAPVETPLAPVEPPVEPNELLRKLQEECELCLVKMAAAMARLNATHKKWEAKLTQASMINWKVMINVRRTGPLKGGHYLKFVSPEGKAFSSFKKAFAFASE